MSNYGSDVYVGEPNDMPFSVYPCGPVSGAPLLAKSYELEGSLKGKYIFSKYPEFENGKDMITGKFFYVDGGNDDLDVIAHSMRGYLPAALTGATFLMPEQAPQEQLDNLEYIFGIRANTICYDANNPDEYMALINELPDRSLLVMHPYDGIDSEKYLTSPDIVYELNDKSNLNQLTPYVPRQEIRKLGDLDKSDIFKAGFPFVVKRSNGASGHGVKIIYGPEDLDGLNGFALSNEDLIIQQYVAPETNHGVHFLINDSEVYYLGKGVQMIGDRANFEGSAYSADEPGYDKQVAVAYSAALSAAEKGYNGFCGFDVITTNRGDCYVIDPNIRMTGTAPLCMLKIFYPDILEGDGWSIKHKEMKADSSQKLIDTVQTNGDKILLAMSQQDENTHVYKYHCLEKVDGV